MQNVIPIKRELDEPASDDWMSFRQCADKHRCSVSYIYKLYYSGKIERRKEGKWKVSYSQVVAADGNC